MNQKPLITVLLSASLLTACAGMTSTQQRTLSGAAIGTAGGMAIGAIAGGSVATGAAVGAAAGAVGGYLYDQNQKTQKRRK